MNYLILILASTTFTVSMYTVSTYFYIKKMNAVKEYKVEGLNFIKSEMNNIVDHCPNDGDTQDNETYSFDWNYDNSINVTLSCENDSGTITFDYEGCMNRIKSSEDQTCYTYSGEI